MMKVCKNFKSIDVLVDDAQKNKITNLKHLVDEGILEQEVADCLINDPDFP